LFRRRSFCEASRSRAAAGTNPAAADTRSLHERPARATALAPPPKRESTPNRQQTPVKPPCGGSINAGTAGRCEGRTEPPPSAQLPTPARRKSGRWPRPALSSPLAAAKIVNGFRRAGRHLPQSDIAKFKAHLQGCWKPSERLADGGKAMVVLRVSLQPNGALTKEPTLLAASGSEEGLALMKTAVQAVRQCQPYAFLPAAGYKEWKVLDLAFSPAGLTGLPRI
jgi:hypothetical protein